jgi:LacI family transcriptional regulator
MKKRKRSVLVALTDTHHGFFKGVARYAREHRWHLVADMIYTAKIPLGWRGDGIISFIGSRDDLADFILATRLPAVEISMVRNEIDLPRVEGDSERIGRLAAEHFLERGFENFGYFGSAWTGFSKQREQGYRQTLIEAGHSLSSCYSEFLPSPPTDASWTGEDRQVRDWLQTLPKPAGVLASNDLPARRLADMCRQMRIRVPEEVAILGVDNDELECLLSQPPLSSVVNPAEQIGFEAAKLLDQLMSGQQPPSMRIVVPPVHVVVRQSTDVVAVADENVSAAIAFIRGHVVERLLVGRVADHVMLSRRGLERRFRHLLGRSVLEEIQRARIERAKSLLAETDLPMPLVADRCGFQTPQRLATVFKQFTNLAPTAYRQLSRARPAGGTEAVVK